MEATGEAESGEEAVAPVVEEADALLNQRCKLFYLRDGAYVEKGVGTLYIKQLANGRPQLLVRYVRMDSY